MALEVPLGVILIWPGTDAGIPAGWERETDLDEKFPRGADNAVDPGGTGGSDTHTHTSPVHTHNSQAHRHFGQTNSIGSSIGEDTGGPSHDASHDDHYHNFDFTNITGGSLADAVTYAAGDSKPPYYEIIFIKPDTVPASPPDGVIALFDRVDLPTDWDICNGSNGTPNLHNKYIRGAAAAGDSGATGGSLNHSHSVNHTHSSKSHYHVELSQNDGGADRDRNSSGSGGAVVPRHAHSIALDPTADTGDAYVGTAGSADTVEPLYKKLLAIQNNTGGDDRPQWIIGLWLGLLADIPEGWNLLNGNVGTVDMRNFHLKITNTVLEVGLTGGSNTHTHAPSNSHTHNASGSHTHTGSSDTYVANGSTGAGGALGAKTHSHSIVSCSANTISWDNATIQADSSNGQPAYKRVAFIQFAGQPAVENRNAKIRGAIASSGQRSMKLRGVLPSGERIAKLQGKDQGVGQRGARIAGMIEWVVEPRPVLDDFSA